VGRAKSRGRIGLLQIGTGFHPELSGRENIYLNGAILGLKKKEIDFLYEPIIAFAELEKFIDEPIRNYSSGMVARLGFSIAINVRPEILLIDEVLSVGDEGFKSKCREKIKELRASGITIVFVSHSMGDVRRICDRGICLSQGQLVFEGDSSAAADYYLENLSTKR
jgi:ABC-type polysaccharide/polyol phosphate transport system ATPase subunit